MPVRREPALPLRIVDKGSGVGSVQRHAGLHQGDAVGTAAQEPFEHDQERSGTLPRNLEVFGVEQRIRHVFRQPFGHRRT